MTYSEMAEEDRKIYDRAFGAAQDIETVACYLLGDIGYWGEGNTSDGDRLAMAERHLSRLLAHAQELGGALEAMRRAIHEEEGGKENANMD